MCEVASSRVWERKSLVGFRGGALVRVWESIEVEAFSSNYAVILDFKASEMLSTSFYSEQ